MITVSAKSISKPLKHFWSFCVGAGRANEGLRANWQEHLKLVVKECGFKYLRFHGLFHDDMFVYRIIDGEEVYNWQYIDELFDRMLDIGIRPFVEFGFCPKDMASGERTQFWWKANVSPPKDYSKWSELVTRTITHWTKRYGLEEVKKWYFEVWNEPNLRAFWDGTKSEYFKLYKVTVNAVKSIEPSLRVGGPATSNFVPDDRFAGETEDLSKHMTFKDKNVDMVQWKAVWVEDFLGFCEKEKLPVDFISTHPYPTDFAIDMHGKYRGFSRNVNATRKDLQWLRNLIDKSAYPKAEIHLTEWNSSPSPRDCSHDYLPAAAFVAKVNIESSGLVDSLSYWTFTDVFEESGAGSSIFHGGFGLVNFQGIVKPTFHAYRFLNLLGDEELARGDGYIITRKSEDGKISVLVYNYPEDEVPQSVPISPFPNRNIAEEIQSKGSARNIEIEICDLNPGTRFLIETVDEEHGFAIKKWKEMGQPEPPTREQIVELRRVAMETKKDYIWVNTEGKLILKIKILPWSIISIREE